MSYKMHQCRTTILMDHIQNVQTTLFGVIKEDTINVSTFIVRIFLLSHKSYSEKSDYKKTLYMV